MKVIFNFVTVAALAATLLCPAPAEAGKSTSKQKILAAFFPTSKKVSYVTFTPNAAERVAIGQRLGYKLNKRRYYFYVARTDGRIDGYAFIDDELGQHEPITYAVKLTPAGVVQQQEVLAYRERFGAEIGSRRFRRQFIGKTVRDPVRAGRDIHIVSGATISSHSMARGVRRALVLFDVAIGSKQATRRTASIR